MEWEKLVEREGDFLKNCLLFESFAENFVRVFNRSHSDFLTTRKGNVFTHYVHTTSGRELSFFIKKQLETNPNFMKEVVERGKSHFNNLIIFSKSMNDLNLKELNIDKLKELIVEYFRLYKEPYPYFNLTVFSDELENKKDIIDLMADWRLFARTHFNKTHQLISPLFEEVGRRLNISVEELKFLKPKEIENLLQGEKIDIKEIIEKRQNSYFLYQDGGYTLFENKSFVIKEILDNKLEGRGTFPAFYRGKVKIIKNMQDFDKLDVGDVIVLRMTTPDLVTEGIKKAGAIITDEGGITSHAAVLSREFNIPALMGTKNATKLLKDGDIVEIDTRKGIANKI